MSTLIKINNGCAVPLVKVQYYQQHDNTMSKYKNLKIPSPTVGKTGNGPITHLSIVVVSFKLVELIYSCML